MPKHELVVRIDPLNPAQFYACCGMAELFDLRGGRVLTQFCADPPRSRSAEFRVSSDAPLHQAQLLAELRAAAYERLEHEDKQLAPVRVHGNDWKFELDWWLNEFRSEASPLKTWAGRIGPKDFFENLPAGLRDDLHEPAFVSPVIGLDPRSAWIAGDIGYSPNDQNHDAVAFPAVELLAAFGLQGFRPVGRRQDGFTYSLWEEPLPLLVSRAGGWAAWRGATYQFQMRKRGSYSYFDFAQPVALRGAEHD